MSRMFKEGVYQWESRKFLGEGSFGKVYKGKNTKTREDVAVKVLDLRHFSPKDMVALKNEIQVMKLLNSDNVVHMLDCFSSPKETYIFMEYCEGGDLRQYITQKNGKLPEKQAITILHQVMLGLQEVYLKGYMHRDIKPENILLSKNIFKIADFGFATKIHPRGRQLLKEFVGTPLYMAPQLLDNCPYSTKSDVWSIGMTFFEMIFGKTPWPARDINSFLKNIKNMPLRFPYDKPIGNQTKDFITRCLTIEEEKRMSWEEVFDHPILKLGAGDIIKPEITIDEKVKKILRSMQEEVQTKNLDIATVFAKFDQDQGGSLDDKEFLNFLQSVDSRVTFEESQEVFRVVDISKDKTISLQEFAAIFCHYDFADIDDPAQNIICDLREIIKANHMNLQQIFVNFDKSGQGTLNRTEFESLLRIVAPALKNHEVQKCFVKFDKDKDSQISFDEFKQALAYGLPKPETEHHLFKEKAKRIISELRKIIKENNIDIRVIFRNFDKTKDCYLDLSEFKKLILILDKRIVDNELNYIFKLFDVDNDHKISFPEFSQFLS